MGGLETARPFREGAALVTDVDFGIFSITGKDAASFLHRQLSNEIRNLEIDQGIPTCFLNREGRILLYFTLWKTPEGYRALIAGKQKDDFIPLLDRVLFAEDVRIQGLSESLTALILGGQNAGSTLSRASGDVGLERAPHSAGILTFAGASVDVYSVDWLACPTYVLAPPTGAFEQVVDSLLSAGATRSTLEAFHVLRIEKGSPWPEFEVDESMIPFECGLGEVASVTKGCYVGQEIISRMHHLGKPPRLLVGLVIEGQAVPERGAAVLAGTTEVGKVLSAAFSDHIDRVLATSSIRRKFAQPGTELQVGGMKALVQPFPLA